MKNLSILMVVIGVSYAYDVQSGTRTAKVELESEDQTLFGADLLPKVRMTVHTDEKSAKEAVRLGKIMVAVGDQTPEAPQQEPEIKSEAVEGNPTPVAPSAPDAPPPAPEGESKPILLGKGD